MALDVQPLRASASGKVLLLGGYLVLDPHAAGATLSVSSRFHAAWSATGGDCGSDASSTFPVRIVSRQFRKEWEYEIRLKSASFDTPAFATLAACNPSARNVYAEFAINTALICICGADAAREHLLGLLEKCRGFHLDLLADNDFYSQRQHLLDRGLPVTSASLASLENGLPCPLGSDGSVSIHKTGLGSSAALVTSVVAASLAFFGGLHTSLEDIDFKRLCHDVAQVAHGLAQGKVWPTT